MVYDREHHSSCGSASLRDEGWGLTTDGRRLLMERRASTLRWRIPILFAETGKIEVQIRVGHE